MASNFLEAEPMPLNENGQPKYASVLDWVKERGRQWFLERVSRGASLKAIRTAKESVIVDNDLIT